jgi:hypothetical protein
LILVHGECGSGKSTALRALEAAPPAGFRAAYVPVPTLDFPGIARWCASRLGLGEGRDPADALHAAATRAPIALLIDDAEDLPIDAAHELRRCEEKSLGAITVVAACGSDPLEAESPAVAALGAPDHTVVVGPERGEHAAAALRARLAPETVVAQPQAPAAVVEEPVVAAPPATAPPRVRPGAAAVSAPTEGQPVPDARPASAAGASAQPAMQPESRGPEPPPARPERVTRTIPLSTALALAAAAFLVPVAFGAGYLVGGGERRASPALAEVAASAPPAVSAPPPVPEIASAESAAAPETPRAEALPPARREASRRAARESANRGAILRAAPASPATTPRDAGRAVAPEPARDADEWGAPALISVEPGRAGS